MSTSLQNVRSQSPHDNTTNPSYDRLDSEETQLLNVATASVASSVINLCNSSIGAALLGLPYAASQVGWIMSIIMLIAFAIISQWTFQLDTSSGIRYNVLQKSLSSSYYNLSKATKIPKLEIVADLTIFLNAFGAQCAYLVIIGDLMPDAMAKYITNDNNDIVLKRRFWIILYTVILIVPCSLLKKLDFLRFTSLFAMLCFTFITLSMILFLNDSSVNLCDEQLIKNKDCGLQEFIDFNDPNNVLNFFKAAPIYMFAFGTHPLAFSLTNELSNIDDKRMNIVTVIGFSICTFYYISIGLLGYWTFGNNAESNILNNYPQKSMLLFCVRIGLSIALAFSYPVVITPGRQSLSAIIYKLNADQISSKQFYMLTFIIIICSLIIAMAVSDLGTVLGFIGSTSQPMCILILPGLFYFYYMDNHNNQMSNCTHKINKYVSVLSFLFGVILIPFSLVVFFI